MDEQIISTVIGGDKAITLFRVKPLHSTCSHVILLWPKKGPVLLVPRFNQEYSPRGQKVYPLFHNAINEIIRLCQQSIALFERKIELDEGYIRPLMII
jgi:hypothetical protein